MPQFIFDSIGLQLHKIKMGRNGSYFASNTGTANFNQLQSRQKITFLYVYGYFSMHAQLINKLHGVESFLRC